jgi:hypothetical protein
MHVEDWCKGAVTYPPGVVGQRAHYLQTIVGRCCVKLGDVQVDSGGIFSIVFSRGGGDELQDTKWDASLRSASGAVCGVPATMIVVHSIKKHDILPNWAQYAPGHTVSTLRALMASYFTTIDTVKN